MQSHNEIFPVRVGERTARQRTWLAGSLHGFTLVELLVVVAIIALLLAILLPGLNKAMQAAKQVVCMNNLKQIYLAEAAYEYDNTALAYDMVNAVPLNLYTSQIWARGALDGYLGLGNKDWKTNQARRDSVLFCPGVPDDWHRDPVWGSTAYPRIYDQFLDSTTKTLFQGKARSSKVSRPASILFHIEGAGYWGDGKHTPNETGFPCIWADWIGTWHQLPPSALYYDGHAMAYPNEIIIGLAPSWQEFTPNLFGAN